MGQVIESGAAEAAQLAADVLRSGGVVLLATDTLYGIAALPADEAAVASLFALKGRGADVPVAVLCADAAQALALADPNDSALQAVADRWWPGPLTIVARRSAAAAGLHLGEPHDTIGLRVPDHDLVRAIAALVGPIATTSANRHGMPTPPSAAEAAASLLSEVALVIDGGLLDNPASTVIDATASPWRSLRTGALDPEAIVAGT